MKYRKIKEATNDCLVLVDDTVTVGCIFWSLVTIVVVSFFLLCIIYFLTVPEYSGERLERLGGLVPGILIFIIFGGYRGPGLLHDLLVEESVVIDRNLQNIIIKGDSFINSLEFTKKIRFSDIKNTEITIDILDGRVTGHRDVRLITIHGAGVKIYDGDCETAERLGKKIHEITGKQTSHKKHYRSSNNSS